LKKIKKELTMKKFFIKIKKFCSLIISNYVSTNLLNFWSTTMFNG